MTTCPELDALFESIRVADWARADEVHRWKLRARIAERVLSLVLAGRL